MFESKTKIEEEKQAAKLEFSELIKSWHTDYEANQKLLDNQFNIESIEAFSVNVWDEIDEHDSTYIFVEMNEVPDSICFSVLNHLCQYLRSSNISNVSFRFYDSTNIYPSNLLTETGRYTSFKRWELRLDDVNHESLNAIVELLKKAPSFNDKKLDVYSES